MSSFIIVLKIKEYAFYCVIKNIIIIQNHFCNLDLVSYVKIKDLDMGWQFSYLILSKIKQINPTELLNCLGFKNLEFEGRLKFIDALNAKSKFIFMGYIEDNLVISVKKLPLDIIKDEESHMLELLFCLFPKSEVCSVYLDVVSQKWGYCLRNKKGVIRTVYSENKNQIIDKGKALSFEKEIDLYNLDAQDLDDFKYKNLPEQEFLLNLTKSFLGKRLDKSNDLIANTKLDLFSYKQIQYKNPEKIRAVLNKDKKKWWNFF